MPEHAHPSQSARERWYEFEQRETFTRPIYVKARSMKDARRRLALDGVADYPPNNPDLKLGGRGRIAGDQEYVEEFARRDAEGKR